MPPLHRARRPRPCGVHAQEQGPRLRGVPGGEQGPCPHGVHSNEQGARPPGGSRLEQGPAGVRTSAARWERALEPHNEWPWGGRQELWPLGLAAGGGVWSKGCGRGEAGWAPLGRGEGSGQRGEGGSLRAVGPSTVGSQAAPSAGWHRPTRVLNRETDARLPRACVVRGLARGPPGGRPPHASESLPRGRPALVRHLLGQ